MNRLQVWVYDIFQNIGAFILAVIMLTVLAGVVSRYFFNMPFSWTEELVTTAMVYLCYTCAPLATISKSHVVADFLKSVVPKKVEKPLSVVIRLLEIFFFVVVAISCARYIPGRTFRSATLRLTRPMFYAPILIGTSVMVIFIVLDLFNDFFPGYNYFMERKKGIDEEEARIEELEKQRMQADMDAFMDKIEGVKKEEDPK
jgi:TRAP-type C4-dicarboxylate transport system permease small subunit